MAYRRDRRAPAPRIAEPPAPITSASPYVPPAGAAYVWLGPEGDLMLGLPPAAGRAGHSVRLSARNPEVMGKLLLRTLAERAATPFARIVEPGVPTQALTDALAASLASGKRVIQAELRAESLRDDDFLD